MEGWTKNLPSIEDTDFTNTSRESVMYAGDEATLLAEFQLEKRDPVTYEEISPYVLEGTVDTEDVRFYEHEGVDIPGIARAFVNNLRGGDLEGASTITQQLVRNTVLSEEATDISFERKIREAELAIDLEKRFSKDDILVKYLNIINYGGRLLRHRSGRAELLPGVGARPDARAGRHARRHPAVAHLS